MSVIVIFLNPGRFLEEAIDSIRRQEYSAWEVLLVDDGSSDGSPAIARKMSEEEPDNFQYLHHPVRENRGMSASRNLGIAKARGRYITFLDADDVYLPDRLGDHVEILDTFPDVQMAQSDHLWWSDWQDEKIQRDKNFRRPFFWPENRTIEPPRALMTVLAAPLLATATCSITVRRSAILSVGGFEDEFRTLYEDQVFLTKIYLQKSIYVIGKCLAKVRVHADSCTNTVAATAHRRHGTWQREERALINWRADYIEKLGIRHPILLQQLRQTQRSLQWQAYRGFIIMLRGIVKRILQAVLTQSQFAAYMTRRRQRQERQTWKQFEELRRMLENYKDA